MAAIVYHVIGTLNVMHCVININLLPVGDNENTLAIAVQSTLFTVGVVDWRRIVIAACCILVIAGLIGRRRRSRPRRGLLFGQLPSLSRLGRTLLSRLPTIIFQFIADPARLQTIFVLYGYDFISLQRRAVSARMKSRSTFALIQLRMTDLREKQALPKTKPTNPEVTKIFFTVRFLRIIQIQCL